MTDTTTTTRDRSADGAALDYEVADLSLAEFGRKEIRLAEHEMPGLMSLRGKTPRSSRSPVPASPGRCT